MSEPPPLIALQGLTKTFGQGTARMQALRGISFEIGQGEFIAIMGPSGSGKSTCMNILGCLDVPSSGHYFFRGVEVGALSGDQRALLRRNFIGFIFQGYNLLPRTTALENVEMPLVYRQIGRRRRRELARKALEDVGLADWADHTPN